MLSSPEYKNCSACTGVNSTSFRKRRPENCPRCPCVSHYKVCMPETQVLSAGYEAGPALKKLFQCLERIWISHFLPRFRSSLQPTTRLLIFQRAYRQKLLPVRDLKRQEKRKTRYQRNMEEHSNRPPQMM